MYKTNGVSANDNAITQWCHENTEWSYSSHDAAYQSCTTEKTPIEKCKESKAAINAMVLAGDISNKVAKELIKKLDSIVIGSNFI
jgi:hypothetical protein